MGLISADLLLMRLSEQACTRTLIYYPLPSNMNIECLVTILMQTIEESNIIYHRNGVNRVCRSLLMRLSVQACTRTLIYYPLPSNMNIECLVTILMQTIEESNIIYHRNGVNRVCRSLLMRLSEQACTRTLIYYPLPSNMYIECLVTILMQTIEESNIIYHRNGVNRVCRSLLMRLSEQACTRTLIYYPLPSNMYIECLVTILMQTIEESNIIYHRNGVNRVCRSLLMRLSEQACTRTLIYYPLPSNMNIECLVTILMQTIEESNIIYHRNGVNRVCRSLLMRLSEQACTRTLIYYPLPSNMYIECLVTILMQTIEESNIIYHRNGVNRVCRSLLMRLSEQACTRTLIYYPLPSNMYIECLVTILMQTIEESNSIYHRNGVNRVCRLLLMRLSEQACTRTLIYYPLPSNMYIECLVTILMYTIEGSNSIYHRNWVKRASQLVLSDQACTVLVL
ncbi:hypothetical protein J6590_015730 [Homalodisca vitripennis]|nr:hypothetical protein J6590_015730 [Homalodisca vitripennis]